MRHSPVYTHDTTVRAEHIRCVLLKVNRVSVTTLHTHTTSVSVIKSIIAQRRMTHVNQVHCAQSAGVIWSTHSPLCCSVRPWARQSPRPVPGGFRVLVSVPWWVWKIPRRKDKWVVYVRFLINCNKYGFLVATEIGQINQQEITNVNCEYNQYVSYKLLIVLLIFRLF